MSNRADIAALDTIRQNIDWGENEDLSRAGDLVGEALYLLARGMWRKDVDEILRGVDLDEARDETLGSGEYGWRTGRDNHYASLVVQPRDAAHAREIKLALLPILDGYGCDSGGVGGVDWEDGEPHTRYGSVSVRAPHRAR